MSENRLWEHLSSLFTYEEPLSGDERTKSINKELARWSEEDWELVSTICLNGQYRLFWKRMR